MHACAGTGVWMRWRGSDEDWPEKQSEGEGETATGKGGNEQGPETSGQPAQCQQQNPDVTVEFEW